MDSELNQRLYQRVLENFQVETERDRINPKMVWLKCTHNGYQWSTISIPEECLIDVIRMLKAERPITN